MLKGERLRAPDDNVLHLCTNSRVRPIYSASTRRSKITIKGHSMLLEIGEKHIVTKHQTETWKTTMTERKQAAFFLLSLSLYWLRSVQNSYWCSVEVQQWSENGKVGNRRSDSGTAFKPGIRKASQCFCAWPSGKAWGKCRRIYLIDQWIH